MDRSTRVSELMYDVDNALSKIQLDPIIATLSWVELDVSNGILDDFGQIFREASR